MHLVALLEAAQNCNGVFNCWFSHVHLLETSLEGRILFYILAIFIQRGCTNHVQFSTGKHGLNHVAGIHGTFGAAGTDQCMNLVDKRDHFTLRVGDFL